MKLLSTISCILLFVCFSIAQDTTGRPGCTDPLVCTNNLVGRLPALTADTTVTIAAPESYAKSTAPVNFRDVSYLAYTPHAGGDCPVTSDDCTHDQGNLMYQAYYPNITKYKGCNLPVIILFHGGGFADCNGSYLDGSLQSICLEFAHRGFVAISAEYRLGVEVLRTGTTASSPYYTVEQMLAIWRAGQDVRGAIRSIVKREYKGLEPFHIDLNRIFVGGNSAGSAAAMNASFYNVQGMVASAFPSNISSANILGSITQDYYFGETAYTYQIAGVLDLWGGILLPNPYTTDESASNLNPPEKFFFQTGNMPPPVIAFCGNKDDVFPPTGEPLIFPNNTIPNYQSDFISTNRCLNDSTGVTYYTVTPNISYGTIMGSQNIYEMLKKERCLFGALYRLPDEAWFG